MLPLNSGEQAQLPVRRISAPPIKKGSLEPFFIGGMKARMRTPGFDTTAKAAWTTRSVARRARLVKTSRVNPLRSAIKENLLNDGWLPLRRRIIPTIQAMPERGAFGRLHIHVVYGKRGRTGAQQQAGRECDKAYGHDASGQPRISNCDGEFMENRKKSGT